MAIQWTEAEVAALRAAVASGVLTVRYDGPPARQVTYQSLSEMRELLAEMSSSAAAASGARSSYRLMAVRKGLGSGRHRR